MASDKELLDLLESTEVKDLLASSGTARNVVEHDLLRRREAIALELSSVTAARDEAVANRVAADRKISVDLETGWHPTRIRFALFILIVAFAAASVTWAFGWSAGTEWLKSWRSPLTSGWPNLIAWTVSTIALAITLFEAQFYWWRLPKRRKETQLRYKVSDLSSLEREASSDWHKQLLEIVRDHVTEIVNADQGPIYGNHLKVRSQTGNLRESVTVGVGLAEVSIDDNHVATGVQKRLLHLFTSLPGASIGISGPRGVGKSSLLSALCGSNPTIAGRPAIAINTSAPVEYDGRDFLLHLFATLCRQVLRTEGEDKLINEYELAFHREQDWRGTSFLNAMPQIGQLLVYIGAALFIVAVMVAGFQSFVTAEQNNQRIAIKADLQQRAAYRARVLIKANENQRKQTGAKSAAATGLPISINNLESGSSEPTESKSQPLQPLDLLVVLASTPLFTLALLAIIFGTLLPLANRTFRQLSPKRHYHTFGTGEHREIVERTLSELHNINFQRTSTSGWSGSLKAPLGIDLGTSAGISVVQRPESLPELVERFRKFVRDVGSAYNNVVLIGIDELDKLKTAQQAEAFLNGVKSVFGIQGCFYLISVSEHALAAFERRGMGFRDAFDSALDDIVHVDFLDLQQSRTLLNRRILRLPDPFLQLCYMLSGGLPRDLIRHARTMLDSAAEGQEGSLSLRQVVTRLASQDLMARIRATSIAMRTVKELTETSELLVLVAKLPSASGVKSATEALSAYRSHLDQLLPKLRDSEEGRILLRLSQELAIYYEMMILLRRVGALFSTEYGWSKATKHNLAGQVASVRQALEAGVALAEVRLAEVRAEVDDVGAQIGLHVHPRPSRLSAQSGPA